MMPRWILVVDDDASSRAQLMLMLSDNDFFCHAESSGEKALNLLRINPHHFVMVITAMRMPDEGDGLRLLAAIKADEALQHLPVLMTGSTFTSEEITEAGRLGAFAWSNRSFETEPFLFTIRRELARLGVNP
jgi:two-component system chemotaxis response regulator CheY